MAKKNFYIADSKLDKYQIDVINKKTDTSLIVKGCAGSGKSILALWKAKRIQDEKKGSYLFIVYTKTLKQYMTAGISEIGISRSNVVLFDSWKTNHSSADYIIVDEVQDFSKEDIELLFSAAKKNIFLYGDSAQQLYQFRAQNPAVSIEEIQKGYPQLLVETLVWNHRLPKKIARLAQYLNSGDDDESLVDHCTDEGTEKPKILRYNSVAEQYDAIISLIQNKNMEDVGILFRNNNEVKNAYDYFKNKGINVETKYDIKETGQKHMNLSFLSDNPKIMTYHSSKGLQFENVFIPECSVEGAANRKPLYVAITRTYNSLYIMYSGSLSILFDDVPPSIYDTTLNAGPKLAL